SVSTDHALDRQKLAIDRNSLGLHGTYDQKTKIMLRSTALMRKIEAWIEAQHMYIPALHVHCAHIATDRKEMAEFLPQDIALFLPSALPSGVSCDVRLNQIEWQLRHAQCGDALDDLRDSL
ncbi:hypothetical protein GALMADRAFT_76094, partial [Galerina marginata CBS 339.88]